MGFLHSERPNGRTAAGRPSNLPISILVEVAEEPSEHDRTRRRSPGPKRPGPVRRTLEPMSLKAERLILEYMFNPVLLTPTLVSYHN